MCICTPEKRTPWCGKPGCEMPKQTITPAIDAKKMAEEYQQRAFLECGEWIAKLLLKEPLLIRSIPAPLYAYYQTWLKACMYDYHSNLFEQHFRKKLENK